MQPYVRTFRSPNNKSSANHHVFTTCKKHCKNNKYGRCDKFYEIPSTIHERGTSFGYGHKSDFTKKSTKTPSPHNYLIKGIFEVAKKKKDGFAFPSGREQSRLQGPFGQLRKTGGNPGPGTYNHKSQLSKSTHAFPHAVLLPDKEQGQVPGVGQYQLPLGYNKGKHILVSKFKSPRATSFSADNSKRFNSKNAKVPGPADYNIEFKSIGVEFPSKFRTTLGQSFPHSPRKTSLAEGDVRHTPGPGHYQFESQFGERQLHNNKENMGMTNRF